MIFKQILNIRDQLVSIADKNNSFVASVAADVIDATASGSTQIDGIRCSLDSNGLLSVSNGDNIISIAHSDILDHLSDIIPGTSYAVSDVLQGISSTGDMYSVLGSITTKMSYSERMTLSDINQIIEKTNANVSAMNYNMSELQDQLVAISDDGYVTNQGWLAAMKSWFEACSSGADNESPELDSTSAGTISSLYYVISNVISTVVNVIFAALGAIFHGLFYLIGAAFSALSQLLNTVIDESISTNPLAPNCFMRGYIQSLEKGNYQSFGSLTTSDYAINYMELPSVGFFFWQGKSKYSVRMNSFAQPTITPYMLGDALAGLTSQQLADLGISFDISNTDPTQAYIQKHTVNSMYASLPMREMNADEQALIMNDPAFYSVCLCVSEFYRWILSAPYKVGNDIGAQSWQSNKITSYGIQDAGIIPKVVIYGWLCTYYYMTGRDIYTPGRTNVCDAINDWVSYHNSHNFDVAYKGLARFYNGTCHMVVVENPLICASENDSNSIGLRAIYSYSTQYYEPNIYSLSWHYTAPDVMRADCIPTTWGAKCEAITSETAIKVMVMSATIAIAAAAVTSKLNRAIRRKKIKKSILRSQALANSREAYLRDPNDTDKLEAYVKQVDKYNRMGKMFGWGSYDAANAWFDASSSSANSNPSPSLAIAAVSGSVSDLYNNINGLGKIVTDIGNIYNSDNGLGKLSTDIGNIYNTDDGLGKIDNDINNIYNTTNGLGKITSDINNIYNNTNGLGKITSDVNSLYNNATGFGKVINDLTAINQLIAAIPDYSAALADITTRLNTLLSLIK